MHSLDETHDTTTKQSELNITGFSERFSLMLDRIGAPDLSSGRFTWGATEFGVAITTFRAWCLLDKLPRRLPDLYKVIDKLLARSSFSSIKTEYVVSWLLTGVNDPWDTSSGIDLYVVIVEACSRASKARRLDFEQLPMAFKTKLVGQAARFCTKNGLAPVSDLADRSMLEAYVGDMLDIANQ